MGRLARTVKRVLRTEIPAHGELGKLNGAKVAGDNNVGVLALLSALLARLSSDVLSRSSRVRGKGGADSTEGDSKETDARGDAVAVEMVSSSSVFMGGRVSIESSSIRTSCTTSTSTLTRCAGAGATANEGVDCRHTPSGALKEPM